MDCRFREGEIEENHIRKEDKEKLGVNMAPDTRTVMHKSNSK